MKQQKKPFTLKLTALDKDTLFCILQFLDFRSLEAFRYTSQHFKSELLITSSITNYLWVKLYEDRFPKEKLNSTSPKETFIERDLQSKKAISLCNLPTNNHSALLKNDAEYSIKTLKNNGLGLSSMSLALRSHKQVVITAVKATSHAIYYASKALQNDPEVLIAEGKHQNPKLMSQLSDIQKKRYLETQSAKRPYLAELKATTHSFFKEAEKDTNKNLTEKLKQANIFTPH